MLHGVMTKEKAEELGVDQFIHCVKFNYLDDPEDTSILLQLNVLGLVYGVRIPRFESNDEQNIIDGWRQCIQEFGTYHMLGHSKKIQHGSRKLSEEESKILELKK
jgi:hypothetical protein